MISPTPDSIWAVTQLRAGRLKPLTAGSGRTPPAPLFRELAPLLATERFGDRALRFVWRNKGASTVSTVLATILAKPEALLGGPIDYPVECPIQADQETGWLLSSSADYGASPS